MTEEKKHSKFSPSKWGDWDLCPHMEGTPGTSAAADKGSLLHLMIEKPELDRSGLDEDDLALLKKIEDFMKAKFDVAGDQYEILNEYYIDLAYLGIPDLEGGTADKVIYDKTNKTIYLFDWKFGQVEVNDAEDNWQQQGYSVGLFRKYPEAVACWSHLLQPKLDQVSIHEWKREETAGIEAKIQALYARVQDRDSQPYPLEPCKACAFCKHKGNCAMYTRKGEEFMENQIVPAPSTAVAALKKSALQMTPVERGAAFGVLKMLEDWVKAKKSDITSCAQEGSDVEGYALRKIAGKRVIESPLLAYSALEHRGDLDEFVKVCKVSITDFEKYAHEQVTAAGVKQTKKKTQEQVETYLSATGTLLQEAGYSYLVEQK
jgi:hypothetical protein